MHKPAFADVDANVGIAFAFLVEKQQVATTQMVAWHSTRGTELMSGVAGHFQPRQFVAVLHQTAAVESTIGAVTTEAVAGADEFLCMGRRPFTVDGIAVQGFCWPTCATCQHQRKQ